MKTNRMFLLLSVAATLLCTACSSDDDSLVSAADAKATEWKTIHYEATVSDGTTTRATLDGENKYIFESGDKLIVAGENIKGELALKSGDEGKHTDATFEGDLEYTGDAPTAGTSLTATLVSNNDAIHTVSDKAITATSYAATLCTTRAEAIQKLSNFTATSTYGAKSFSLSQKTAFLDFTVTMADGTANGASVAVSIKNNGSEIVSGNVSTTKPGNAVIAHFIAGIADGTTLTSATVQLGSRTALSIVASKVFSANKFYNVARTQIPTGALSGKFSVSANKQVYFSQGNLQYDGTNWKFADNQYDYLTTHDGTNWDKFGWSTSATNYGMKTSTSSSKYSGDFVDWGATIGEGWRTLTGGDNGEWKYLFNTRSASTVGTTANARYAKAKVNNVQGIILFPDAYTHPSDVTTPTGINVTGNTGWNGNTYDATAWSKMETAGCVFLPAAGDRYSTSVDGVGSYGRYWSSTAYDTDNAYRVDFGSSYVHPVDNNGRGFGYSVRLVYNAN